MIVTVADNVDEDGQRIPGKRGLLIFLTLADVARAMSAEGAGIETEEGLLTEYGFDRIAIGVGRTQEQILETIRQATREPESGVISHAEIPEAGPEPSHFRVKTGDEAAQICGGLQRGLADLLPAGTVVTIYAQLPQGETFTLKGNKVSHLMAYGSGSKKLPPQELLAAMGSMAIGIGRACGQVREAISKAEKGGADACN